MEWENKFSSIVRETETNLARVRDRLGSTSKTKAFRPGSSGNRYDAGNLRSQPSRSAYNGTVAWDLQSSKHSPVKTVGMTTSVPSSQTSPALVNALFERVEEQAEVVSHLTDTVKRLEKEKDVQAAEIKKMKDEMSNLSERLREKGVDMETERKLEQFKRDVYSQLEFVQSQAKLKLTSAENSSFSDSAVVNEARKMIEDETESFQREIKQLKTKLGKMEMELQSTFAESRDVLRKQDRLDRALSSLSENQRSQSRSLSSLVDERQSASYEMQQLKQHVNKVSHQYSELESELQSSIRHSGFSSRSSSLRRPHQRGSRQTKTTNGDSKPRTKGVKKKSENLVLSSSSDTDLSLTALDISSPSDTDLISSEFPRSNGGVSANGLGNISSSSLSSLDSDDLLK